MKLIKRLFPNYVKWDELGRRNEELRKERDVLQAGLHDVNSRMAGLNAELAEVKARVIAAEGKVRAQTEADLMLVSVKIIANILKGEKPTQDDLLRQSALNQQMGALNNYSPYSGSGLSFLGTLGWPPH